MIPLHLATLLQATTHVSPEVISNCRSVTSDCDIKYVNERSFAYELYRRWQNLVEGNKENLVVNAEVTKQYEDDQFLRVLCEIFGTTKDGGKPHSRFYPDLVFHHSQFDSEKQEVICEIKTMDRIDDNNNSSLSQDLRKLAAYMTDKVLLYHPFKIGVFILVGGSLSEIKSRYESNSLVVNKTNDIYCITYNIKRIEDNIYIPEIICKSLAETLR